MLLVRELKKGDNFDGGNLVALLELFAEHLAAAGSDEIVGVIDARMGEGLTRALATAVAGPPMLPAATVQDRGELVMAND